MIFPPSDVGSGTRRPPNALSASLFLSLSSFSSNLASPNGGVRGFSSGGVDSDTQVSSTLITFYLVKLDVRNDHQSVQLRPAAPGTVAECGRRSGDVYSRNWNEVQDVEPNTACRFESCPSLSVPFLPSGRQRSMWSVFSGLRGCPEGFVQPAQKVKALLLQPI